MSAMPIIAQKTSWNLQISSGHIYTVQLYI
jgi:hypothetical protein